MTEIDYGQPPKSGWAKLVSELHVTDIEKSCAFWQGLLGFEVAYQRPEERFVYLEHPEGAQIMLCQRNGRFETGSMEPPFGRGAMFQIYLSSLADIMARLSAADWPLYAGPQEIWRRWGDREGGKREIFLQDPDGYLVMVAEDLGERPVSNT